MDINPNKVRKLQCGGAQAIRVCQGDSSAYKDIAGGNFQFGNITTNAFAYSTVILILLSIVFMSPESATTSPWKQLYKEKFLKQNLVVIAIDEAHCIQEWLVHKFISSI